MTTALVKLSSLGDIIHSLIVPPLLKKRGEEVHFVVDSNFKEIVTDNPYISQIVEVPLRRAKREKNWRLVVQIWRELGRFEYRKVVDLQGLIKSGVIARRIVGKGGEVVGGVPPRERLVSLFYNRKVPIDWQKVAAERYMEIAGVLDRQFLIDHPPLVGYPPFSDPHLSQTRKNVAFIIGSTWECRKLPVETWVKIGEMLKGWNILIPYWGEKEREYAFQIAERIEATPLSYPLRQLKALLSKVDLILGHDTGPTFIGWANNIPNIILYTCTYRNKILENRWTKSVEVQRGQVDRNLYNAHLLDPKLVEERLNELPI